MRTDRGSITYHVNGKIGGKARKTRFDIVQRGAAEGGAVLLDLLIKALTVSTVKRLHKVLTSMMPDIRKLVWIEILHSSLRAVSFETDGCSSGASGHDSLHMLADASVTTHVFVNSRDIQSSTKEPWPAWPGRLARREDTSCVHASSASGCC